MLHSPGEFTLDQEHQRVTVDRPKADAAIQYLAPEDGLALRQWHGYDPDPSTASPDTWHLEAATIQPRESLRLLTVLLPHRVGAAPKWTATRVDSDTALGVVVRLPKRIVTAAFRTAATDRP